jgi:hypothetical protein
MEKILPSREAGGANRVQSSLLLAPILRHMNKSHIIQPYVCKIHFNIILSSTGH